MKRDKCVIVGLSGGIDSAVASFILKKKGYEVIGVFFKILPDEKEDSLRFKVDESTIESIRQIAETLKIKYKIVDLKEYFKRQIIDYFCRQYKEGKTPNPCIRCNRLIKFNFLLQTASNLKAHFIATGHYAKVDYDKNKKRFILKKAKDKGKDQSYFLYNLRQEYLKRVIFPLGDLTKEEVKRIAKEAGLFPIVRKESQEICFVLNNDYADFLKRYLKEGLRPGPIFNLKGEVVGQHKGLIYYTIGQRKGLGISSKHPLYVVKIDKDNNAIIVGQEKHLCSKEFTVEDIFPTSIENFSKRFRAKVRIRYRHKEADALIRVKEDRIAQVIFDEPQRAITPAQAAVFYKGDVVLGGGIIKNISPKS